MDPMTIAALIGLAGSAVGAAGSIWGNKPEEHKQIPRFTPEQEKGISQLLQQGLGGMGGMGQQMQQGGYANVPGFNQQELLGAMQGGGMRSMGDFDPIAQSMRQGFSEKTLPGIAERFTGMGGQNSSAFGQQLGQAARGLEGDIGAARSQYNLQNRAYDLQNQGQLAGFGQNAMGMNLQNQGQYATLLSNMLNMGLSPRFDTQRTAPGKTGFGEFAQGVSGPMINYGLNSFAQASQGQGSNLPYNFGQIPNIPDYSNPQTFSSLFNRRGF